MALLRKRLLTRSKHGLWELHLPEPIRELLADLAVQLEQEIDRNPDDPSLRRLFPPAYPEDVAHEAEWQVFKADDLRSARKGHLAVVKAIATRTSLDDDDVQAWLMAINSLRLVLGTRLDVSEDPIELEADDPDAPAYALYELLGALLEETISALAR